MLKDLLMNTGLNKMLLLLLNVSMELYLTPIFHILLRLYHSFWALALWALTDKKRVHRVRGENFNYKSLLITTSNKVVLFACYVVYLILWFGLQFSKQWTPVHLGFSFHRWTYMWNFLWYVTPNYCFAKKNLQFFFPYLRYSTENVAREAEISRCNLSKQPNQKRHR